MAALQQVDAGQVHVRHAAPGVEPGLEDRVVVRRRDPALLKQMSSVPNRSSAPYMAATLRDR